MSKDSQAAIDAAMDGYRTAVSQRRIADFDVTAIEGLGVLVDLNEHNPKGTLLTFELLRRMPESQRSALLGFISNGYAINFGLPEGVSWEEDSPSSRILYDPSLIDYDPPIMD